MTDQCDNIDDRPGEIAEGPATEQVEQAERESPADSVPQEDSTAATEAAAVEPGPDAGDSDEPQIAGTDVPEDVSTGTPEDVVKEPEQPEAVQQPEAAETTQEPEPAEAEQEPEPPVAVQKPEPAEAAQEPKPAKVTKGPKPAKATKGPKPAKATKGPKPEETTEDSEPTAEAEKSPNMDWYILKVQSNREDSIREGLMRRVAIAGLEYFMGNIIVPTEKVTELKGGKKRVMKRKLYPGYIVVNMEINDDTWFLVRETPGIGDFTGAAGHPTPMLPHEVARIVSKQEEKSEKTPKLKIGFNQGDQVKINEGTFENFEGEVEAIDQTSGRVTVMINIFGRSTPVELEYWQIESV